MKHLIYALVFIICIGFAHASPVLYPKPLLSRTLQIENKACSSLVKGKSISGQCMFNFECTRQNGKVIGACIDGFLFGACCNLPLKFNKEPENERTDNVVNEQLGMVEGAFPISDDLLPDSTLPTTVMPIQEETWATEVYTVLHNNSDEGLTDTSSPEPNYRTTTIPSASEDELSTTLPETTIDIERPQEESSDTKWLLLSSSESNVPKNKDKEESAGETTTVPNSQENTTFSAITENDNNVPISEDIITVKPFEKGDDLNDTLIEGPSFLSTNSFPDKLITFVVTTESSHKSTKPTSITHYETSTKLENKQDSSDLDGYTDPLAIWTTQSPVKISEISVTPNVSSSIDITTNKLSDEIDESLLFWTTTAHSKPLQNQSSIGAEMSDFSPSSPTLMEPPSDIQESVLTSTTSVNFSTELPAEHTDALLFWTTTSPSSEIGSNKEEFIKNEIPKVPAISDTQTHEEVLDSSNAISANVAPEDVADFVPVPSVPLRDNVQIVTLPAKEENVSPPLDVNLLIQLLNLTTYIPEEGIFIPPSVIAASVANQTVVAPQMPIEENNSDILVRDGASETTTTSTTTPTTTTTTTSTTTTTTSTTTKKWNWRKTCGVRPLVREGRIVNGRRSDFGEWPWQALVRESTWLGIFTKNKCGGVLLNSKYVLTAAHCKPGFLASLIVVLGELDVTGEYEPKKTIQRNVKRVVVHRDFVARTFDNDLALLELEKPVEFDEHVLPICMPQSQNDFIGRTGFVSGWGRLSYQGSIPNRLYNVAVPVIPNDECQNWFREAGHAKKIKPEFMCAGFKQGKKDSCEGDSGGPFSMRGEDGRWFLAGIVSHGIKCAYPNLPGIYMRMTYYRPWIESVINS